MSNFAAGLVSFLVLLLLLALRVPIGVAMMAVGAGGFIWIQGLGPLLSFLKTTPHGRLPFLVMVPWFICGIAIFVELNFRGFLLGRLAVLESGQRKAGITQRLSPFALITCALLFAFDPFMVNTFQHLHWIALWDGLIWGIIWLRTHNLYITIVAHAVEVIAMYSAVRFALMS